MGGKKPAKTKLTHFYKRSSPGSNNFPPQEGKNKVTSTRNCREPSSKGKNVENYLTTVKQINMQKKKSACRTYFQELKNNEILIGQEPYFHKNKLVSVPNSHKSFTPYHKDTPRVCIILPIELGKLSYTMTPFCNRDMITVKCNLKNRSDVLLCSLYMGHEPNKPEICLNTVEKMSKLVEFSKTKNIPLIMGADSNGHHTLWNSFKQNDRRGILLAQLIERLNLTVANKGKKPTFLNSRGHKSIIDITMSNKKGDNLISNWRVSSDTSLSDHKMIVFNVDLGNKWESYERRFKDMDTEKYKTAVGKLLASKPIRARTGKYKRSNIDESVKYINKVLNNALDETCPMIKITHKSKVPWTRDLNKLKIKAKQTKNSAIAAHSKKASLSTEEIAAINAEQTATEAIYKKAIIEQDRKAYREYCSNISHSKNLAKVPKKKSQQWEQLNVLRKADGSYTEESSDTLEVLAAEHFPTDTQPGPLTPRTNEPFESSEDQNTICEIFHSTRMDRVLKSLPLNKAPGMDNIRNKMVVAAWDHIKQPLQHIYKQCMTYSYCPASWKTCKGIIIPKEGKDDYSNPRAFRIISLTSNLQKLMERLILDYLERNTGVDRRLTKNQFGFRKRKSTEAAIHRLTRKIEDAIQNGQYGLGVFLDVEGAFDNIKFSSIHNAMIKAKIPPMIALWIKEMLIGRTIILTLHGISITKKILKGCPQGGILSPLLWNLTLNTLLSMDQLDSDFLQAFADDLAVLVPGFDLSATMRDIAIRYLKIISKWCTDNGVKLSTIKTKVIVFSGLKKKFKMKPIYLDGEVLNFSDEMKYLDVTFDKHLRWDTHIKLKCQQATKLLHMSRNFTAKSWGLSPGRIRWIYRQVILPTISYACFVWIHRLSENANLRNLLSTIQKMATLYITGGLQKTPNITLDILSGLMPIDVHLKFKASKTAIRLKLENNWIGQYSLSSKIISHAKYLDLETSKLGISSQLPLLDRTTATYFDFSGYTVLLELPQDPPLDSTLKIYTDGSLKSSTQLTGAGFTMTRNGRTIVEQSISLGTHATINQSEMFAIYRAAEILNEANTTNQVINFYSDSLSSLLQLKKGQSTSKLTIDTARILNELSKQNQIFLYKVAAHTGIAGNERADKLAKLGASHPPIGPEPFLCISWNNVISDLLNKAKNETLHQLNNHRMKEESKTPLESYINRYGISRLACREKIHLRLTTHMCSGQNWLKNSLSKRDHTSAPLCPRCGSAKETAQHFISECPAYATVRICTFGVPYISLSDILINFGPDKLIHYINKTGRTKTDYFPSLPN